MHQDFADRLEADLASVFFGEYAETVTVTALALDLQLLFESDVDVMDEGGTLDVIANAISIKKGSGIKRGTVFTRADGRQWSVGRLLEKSPDGFIETWEVTPSVNPA